MWPGAQLEAPRTCEEQVLPIHGPGHARCPALGLAVANHGHTNCSEWHLEYDRNEDFSFVECQVLLERTMAAGGQASIRPTTQEEPVSWASTELPTPRPRTYGSKPQWLPTLVRNSNGSEVVRDNKRVKLFCTSKLQFIYSEQKNWFRLG